MSKERYIKIERESAYGDGGGGVYTQFLKVASVDYATGYEWDEIEEMNREIIEEAYQVTRHGGGSFSMWGRADELGLLLHALFGKCEAVKVGSTDAYQLNFTPCVDEIFSLAITEAKDLHAYKYPGQLIQRIEINAEVGNVMTIEVTSYGNGSIVAGDKEVTTYISPQDNPIFTLKNAVIDLGGGVRTDLKSISMTINLNISEDEHTLGSLDLQYQPPGQRREVEINFEFAKEVPDIFADFIAGTEAELIATFETDKEIENGHPYGFRLIIPRVQYRELSASQSGRDPIRTSVPARALYEMDYVYQKGDGTTTVDAEIIAIVTGTLTGTIST